MSDGYVSLHERIEAMIAPTLGAMGYVIVRVQLIGSTRPVLQIMAEPSDGRIMGMEDCVAVSRAVSALLDVEDPIAGRYALEVSSPGIDRPLTRRGDYDRFAGEAARLELAEPVDGRKRLKGVLRGLDGDAVRLEDEDGRLWSVELQAIAKAKLVDTGAKPPPSGGAD